MTALPPPMASRVGASRPAKRGAVLRCKAEDVSALCADPKALDCLGRFVAALAQLQRDLDNKRAHEQPRQERAALSSNATASDQATSPADLALFVT